MPRKKILLEKKYIYLYIEAFGLEYLSLRSSIRQIRGKRCKLEGEKARARSRERERANESENSMPLYPLLNLRSPTVLLKGLKGLSKQAKFASIFRTVVFFCAGQK